MVYIIVVLFKHGGVYSRFRCPGIPVVYKYVWKPAAGEKLHVEQEFNNPMGKFAVKVIKNNETVGHLPREYSQISWYFSHVAERYALR